MVWPVHTARLHTLCEYSVHIARSNITDQVKPPPPSCAVAHLCGRRRRRERGVSWQRGMALPPPPVSSNSFSTRLNRLTNDTRAGNSNNCRLSVRPAIDFLSHGLDPRLDSAAEQTRREGGERSLLNRVSSIPGINLGNRPFGSRSCLSGGDGFNRLIADWLNVCSVRDGNTAGIQLG